MTVQNNAALADGSRGQTFHAMLQELCHEHDREVTALRGEVASLRALLEKASTASGDATSGEGEDGERAPGVKKVLAPEGRHATPPPPSSSGGCTSEAGASHDGTNDTAATLRQLRQATSPPPVSSGEHTSEAGASQECTSDTAAASAKELRLELESPTAERQGRDDRGADGTRNARKSRANKAVFVDAHAMKEKIRQAAMKPEYNVADFYHKTGVWQHIANHPVFERITLGVIAFNAFWIWIDTDENSAELIIHADPIFQILEYFFCAFYAFEWTVRFMAFARKRDCFKDFWFVFDSGLVLFMVGETWVMTSILFIVGGNGLGGNLAILRTARLLRLSRMARMVRLFRMIPELLIMIKGMRAAFRSVFFTLCMLVIILYVFGIAFTQMVGKAMEAKFGTVPTSMHTLLIDGVLLDSAGALDKSLGQLSIGYVGLFYIFILLAALTVMNMLIGVLCEVVSAVAATEKEGIHAAFMREHLEKVWDEVAGKETHTEISKEEFEEILQSSEACKALEEAGVDPIGLVDNIDFIFAGEVEDDDGNMQDKKLSFGDFVSLLLTMRGTNSATVKDIVDLRKYLNTSIHKLRDELRKAPRLGAEQGICVSLHHSETMPSAITREIL